MKVLTIALRSLRCFAVVCLLMMVNSIAKCDEHQDHLLPMPADLKLTVQYSTNQLRVGDFLYGRAVLTNVSQQPVEAKSIGSIVLLAPKIDSGYRRALYDSMGGGLGNGHLATQLIGPGEDVSHEFVIDLFNDRKHYSGPLKSFDTSLVGKTIELRATYRSVAGFGNDSGFDPYLMDHQCKIEFGPPLITQREFDQALQESLKSPEPLPFRYASNHLGLSSYFFRLDALSIAPTDRSRYAAAMFWTRFHRFPRGSAIQRDTAYLVLNKDLISSSEDECNQAKTELFKRLSEAALPEQIFWFDKILQDLKSRYLKRAAQRLPSDGRWIRFRTDAVQVFPNVFDATPRFLDGVTHNEQVWIYLSQFWSAKDIQAEMLILREFFEYLGPETTREDRQIALQICLQETRSRTEWGTRKLEMSTKLSVLRQLIEDHFAVRTIQLPKSGFKIIDESL